MKNDWLQQVQMNEPVFTMLLSNGERLSDRRHVIHYFYDGDVNSLSAALSGAGYEIRPSEAAVGVIAETHAITDHEWSQSEMKRMCDLANQFDAEYDGWECSMVRQPDSN